MLYFLDTNVLVRLLLGDNLEQQGQAVTWFKEAEKGYRTIVVEPVVIAEVCFVLESYYKLTREKISESLEVLIGQRWLNVVDRDILRNLWPYYLQRLHFVNSFLLVKAQAEQGKVLSFNKKTAS